MDFVGHCYKFGFFSSFKFKGRLWSDLTLGSFRKNFVKSKIYFFKTVARRKLVKVESSCVWTVESLQPSEGQAVRCERN